MLDLGLKISKLPLDIEIIIIKGMNACGQSWRKLCGIDIFQARLCLTIPIMTQMFMMMRVHEDVIYDNKIHDN